MGYFGELKTLKILSEHFYWPHMRKDIHKICERCLTCKLDKSRVSPQDFLKWPILFHVTRVIMLHMWPIFSLRIGERSLCSRLGTKLLFSTTCYPQMNGQIEVLNRTLDQLLRCFVKKTLRDWEDWIPYVEFAYNRVFNSTTSYSPFELAYGFNPLSLLDLFPFSIFPNCVNDEGLSKAQFFQRLHDKAWLDMENKGEKYVKNAIRGGRRLDVGTQAPNLRSNSLQKREDDTYTGGHIQKGENEIATLTLEGPMTRDRLKRTQEEVNQELAMLKSQEKALSTPILYNFSNCQGGIV
ncbi:hypothetical protein CR513_18962, partial [Mucuna pruriens]